MAEHITGYIVSLVVIVGIGWVLPRWFGWRRAMRRRWLDATKDSGHV